MSMTLAAAMLAGCRTPMCGPATGEPSSGVAAPARVRRVSPLRHAHAHNDYEHSRPLLDALDRGYMSVEADVHLVDGALLVAHDATDLRADRTLESLYLAPLRRRWAGNGGRIHDAQPPDQPFILLIDLKTAAEPTYAAVHVALARHASMLVTVMDGRVRPGAVQAVISGGRPLATMRAQRVRHAGLDGRLRDLEADDPPHLMPLLSASWWDAFFWWGDGAFPPPQRQRLETIVTRAHAAGRRVRFWATPEDERVWRVLREAGVDLIGTDQLERLAAFLRDRPGPR